MNAESGRAAQQAAYERARAVKQAHEAELLGKPNVIGVGIGIRRRKGEDTGEVALVVMVRRKLPRAGLAPAELLPAELDGVPVDVQEMGEVEAQ